MDLLLVKNRFKSVLNGLYGRQKTFFRARAVCSAYLYDLTDQNAKRLKLLHFGSPYGRAIAHCFALRNAALYHTVAATAAAAVQYYYIVVENLGYISNSFLHTTCCAPDFAGLLTEVWQDPLLQPR